MQIPVELEGRILGMRKSKDVLTKVPDLTLPAQEVFCHSSIVVTSHLARKSKFLNVPKVVEFCVQMVIIYKQQVFQFLAQLKLLPLKVGSC